MKGRVSAQDGWTRPRSDRTSGINALIARGTAGAANLRWWALRNGNGSALSLAIHTDLAPADLGRPAVGHRLAQADRRCVGLCRELGNLGLSRLRERRRERITRRFDDPRADPVVRPAAARAGAGKPRSVSAPGQVHRRPSRPLGPGSPDDATGRRLAGDSGKTETWVILEAEPGSCDLRRIRAGRQREASSPRRSGQDESSPCCTESSQKRAIAS